MELIKINHLTVNLAAKKLFEIASLGINSKQKIGLIGNNGVGKTTLMKLIADINNPSELIKATGSITRLCNWAYVPQLLNAQDKSGGQREKLAISGAIAQLRNAPKALLLLDEPTSNLDFEQQKWLINLIRGLKSSCLIISHDQHFLNQVCDTIWCVKDQRVITFKGTYSEFKRAQEKQAARMQLEYNEQEKHLNQLKASFKRHAKQADSFSHPKKHISSSDWRSKSLGKVKAANNVARATKNLSRRIEKEAKALTRPVVRKQITLKNGAAQMKNEAIAPKSKALRLNPQKVEAYHKLLFTIEQEVNLTYQNKLILTGANGVGKSVFLKELFQRKLTGFYHPQLQIGYFTQNIIKLQSDQTVLEAIMKNSIFATSATMQVLGDLHLWQIRHQKIENLSGGQLVCFNLARILTGKYNLLLLDEPTNFLDLEALAALVDFIAAYPYALIIVSHDQSFIEQLGLPKWTINHQRLSTKVAASKQSSASNDNNLELLKFQRDQLMLAPEASVTKIKQLTAEIEQLQNH